MRLLPVLLSSLVAIGCTPHKDQGSSRAQSQSATPGKTTGTPPPAVSDGTGKESPKPSADPQGPGVDTIGDAESSGPEVVFGPEIDVVETLAGAATLVFRGKVQTVRYLETPQVNDAGEPGAKLPVTAVTYSVDKVFIGAYSKSEITLYFAGGLQPSDGVVVMGMGVTPLFSVGNEDFLFVGNAAKLLPLVSNGRLPIVNGKVFTRDSFTLELHTNGKMVQGVFCPQPQILEHKLGDNSVALRHSETEESAPAPCDSLSMESVEQKLKLQVSAKASAAVHVLTDSTLPAIRWK